MVLMEHFNINQLLGRDKLKQEIIQCVHEIQKSLNNVNSKRVIYLTGDSGSGKSYFMENILNELNYDVIHFETEQNRNSSSFDFIKEHNMPANNVLELMHGKRKRICVLMDNLDSLNTSDKSVLPVLMKLLRPKKTTKQKKEDFCKNMIICIGNNSNDKKIIEFKKICYTFELYMPTDIQMNTIIRTIVKINDPKLISNIQLFVENDLRKLRNIMDIQKQFGDTEISTILDTLVKKYNHNEPKSLTGYLLTHKVPFSKHEEIINDSDRTIISLLLHENIVDYLNAGDIESIHIYSKILSNFCLGDFYDKITFQKQIWLFNEITSLIKNITNNHLFTEHVSIPTTKDIRFTKILTKYSTEYNNINFIISLCQKLGLDKKDLLAYFEKNHTSFTDADYAFFEERYEIKKLDISRLIRFIENKTSKESKESADAEEGFVEENFE